LVSGFNFLIVPYRRSRCNRQIHSNFIPGRANSARTFIIIWNVSALVALYPDIIARLPAAHISNNQSKIIVVSTFAWIQFRLAIILLDVDEFHGLSLS
jgi:hypothetical protein